MFSRLLLFAGLLVGALFTTSNAQAERRIALVIGNSGYAHTQALRNPRNDANDLAQSLEKLGFEVLLGLDLDQQKFAGAVEQFARLLDGADVGLLFYAGHGLQINDRNYLVSVNAKLESEFLISAETIELELDHQAHGVEGDHQPGVPRCLPEQPVDRESPAQPCRHEAQRIAGTRFGAR